MSEQKDKKSEIEAASDVAKAASGAASSPSAPMESTAVSAADPMEPSASVDSAESSPATASASADITTLANDAARPTLSASSTQERIAPVRALGAQAALGESSRDETARMSRGEATGTPRGETADALCGKNTKRGERTEAGAAGRRRVAIAGALCAACIAVIALFAAFGSFSPVENADQPSDQPSEQLAGDTAVSGGESAEDQDEGAEDAVEPAGGEEAEGSTAGESPAGDPSASGGAAGGAAGGSGTDGGSAGGSGNSNPGNSGSQAPSVPSAPDPAPATITVSISIDSSRAHAYDSAWPSSMGSRTVTLSQGASVYDALCAMGVSIGGSSSYVSSINGLAEFSCGQGSGWMYSVNGVFPSKACGKYKLSGGESVRWVYTCNLGNDL